MQGLWKQTLRAMKDTNDSTSEWKATSLALRLLTYLFVCLLKGNFFSFFHKFFNHIWVRVFCVSEVAPSILPLNFFLILYPCTFAPLYTLLSILLAELAYQWSENPYSWDSICQHRRKPQRLVVKLLTNILNTKRLTGPVSSNDSCASG